MNPGRYGILFLAVHTWESPLAVYGALLVCSGRSLIEQTVFTKPQLEGFMALAYPEERDKGVWRAIQWTW